MKTATAKLPPNPLEENCALYVRPLPRALRNSFKAECAKNDLDMIDVLTEFMRQAKDMIPLLRVKRKTKKYTRKS